MNANRLTNHVSDIHSLNPDVTYKNRRYLFVAKAAMKRIINYPLFATYTSPLVGYDPARESRMLETQIFGYFQTFKYLENPKVRQKIDSLYLGTTSADYGKKVPEMKRVPTISVHIRHGDYMKL